MITYNHQKFIRKAIKGVLEQKVSFEMELVISDDCSKDSTVDIIKEEISSNPNPNISVRLIENPQNIGVNLNFIQALNSCHGKYIALCEGDDYWNEPRKIHKQFEYLEGNPDCVMSWHPSKVIRDGSISSDMFGVSRKTDLFFEDLVSGGYTIPTLSTFFRNLVVGKLPEELEYVTNCDTFLFLYLSQFGRLNYDDSIQNVYHVVHNTGVWSSLSLLQKSIKSHQTYVFALRCFRDKRLFVPLVNFGNSVFINSLKAGEYRVSLKYYILNLYYSVRSREAAKVFFNKQVSFIRRSKN